MRINIFMVKTKIINSSKEYINKSNKIQLKKIIEFF
jgi:hypothetical protein